MSVIKNNLPFDIIVFVDDEVDFGDVSILGIGIDPEPSFTARPSNLIDSVIAINNTFCNRNKGKIYKLANFISINSKYIVCLIEERTKERRKKKKIKWLKAL